MSLDNSTIQTPLPGDLQARVENALNQVSTLELEANRLDKMVQVKKGELQNIHNEYKSIENSLKTSQVELDKTNLELTKVSASLNQVQYSIKDANHELEQATKNKVEIEKYVEEIKADLVNRTNRVKEAEAEIEKRLTDLHDKETTHQTKVQRLLEAIK